jgi:hypothetical protein
MTTSTAIEAAPAVTDHSIGGLLERAAAWPLTLLRGLGEVYRRGLTLPLAAPAIAAIVVLPEAVQHVAEIQLGMFASREAFMAHADGWARMSFGYVKIAALFLCILASARFVYCGSVRGALLMPRRDLGRTILALAIGLAASLPAEWAAQTGQPPPVYWPVVTASWGLSLLLLVYLLGALLGDREMTLRTAFTRGCKVLPPLAIFVLAAFWPASTLHTSAHKFALGADPLLVWTIMAGDTLLVGVLATLIGSALAVSYRLGAGAPAKAP